MAIIEKHFSGLSELQIDRFKALKELYSDWNTKINVVSRKDIDELMIRHVLHSLGIAKVQPFQPGSSVLDIGTGGGFPGIPLAIMYPETTFVLVDSIGKKIGVVNEVIQALGLQNVSAEHIRAEQVSGKFDFIVSRAVTRMETFVYWTHGKIKKHNQHELHNGILYLKGGDLNEELASFPQARLFPLDAYFKEPFFETKMVVHLPLKK